MDLADYANEHLPPGPERDEAVSLIRLGQKFRIQQRGKRKGFLTKYLEAIAERISGKASFDLMLYELGIESSRREVYGEDASPVEKIDWEFELVTYHDPKGGRKQITFKALQNKISKMNNPGFP